MARKPKYKEGMVVHPSLGEKVADVIIGIILLACMALAIIPMWLVQLNSSWLSLNVAQTTSI